MTNKPVLKLQCGNIQGAVWENSKTIGDSVEKWYSLSIEKSYKDAKGEWKKTTNFMIDDLPKVREVVVRAYTHYRLSMNE